METRAITRGILYLLKNGSGYFDGKGQTFLEILDFLRKNKVKGFSGDIKEAFTGLKKILQKMEDSHHIEERHFSEKHNGRVDYALEEKGFNLIEKYDRIELGRWKLPK